MNRKSFLCYLVYLFCALTIFTILSSTLWILSPNPHFERWTLTDSGWTSTSINSLIVMDSLPRYFRTLRQLLLQGIETKDWVCLPNYRKHGAVQQRSIYLIIHPDVKCCFISLVLCTHVWSSRSQFSFRDHFFLWHFLIWPGIYFRSSTSSGDEENLTWQNSEMFLHMEIWTVFHT